jgi:hypothetical protein
MAQDKIGEDMDKMKELQKGSGHQLSENARMGGGIKGIDYGKLTGGLDESKKHTELQQKMVKSLQVLEKNSMGSMKDIDIAQFGL